MHLYEKNVRLERVERHQATVGTKFTLTCRRVENIDRSEPQMDNGICRGAPHLSAVALPVPWPVVQAVPSASILYSESLMTR